MPVDANVHYSAAQVAVATVQHLVNAIQFTNILFFFFWHQQPFRFGLLFLGALYMEQNTEKA
jgi:hypothetical protein